MSVYVSTDWTFPSSLRESIAKANAHPGDVHRPCPDIECEHVVWRVLGYCNRRTTCAEIDDEALSEIALPMSPQISEILHVVDQSIDAMIVELVPMEFAKRRLADRDIRRPALGQQDRNQEHVVIGQLVRLV